MDARERIERETVLREARSWVGTRFHTRQAVKARWEGGVRVDPGGVDCATLIAEVYRRAGLIEPVPMPQYPGDWHLHRKTEMYAGLVGERAREIPMDQVLPGDLVMFKFGHVYSHAAIVMAPGWPRICHASFKAECVHLDDGEQGMLAPRPKKFFSLWGRP